MKDNNPPISDQPKAIAQKSLLLSKEETKSEQAPINFSNYTDTVIEQFFLDNNLEKNSDDFYKNMTSYIQNKHKVLQTELDQMLKDDELNTKKINEKKEIFLEKLDFIKNLHMNFEYGIDNLNQLYCDKLSYISILSKNLFEFEKFKRNITFANQIFGYITILNSSDDLSKIAIPDIFENYDKIISEGIEVYLSFQQLLDSCSKYKNFLGNFTQLEKKMKTAIKNAIQECYLNNDLVRLQTMMSVTEVLNSDIVVDLYINYILDDVMKLNDSIESIKKANFKVDGITEELFTLIFKIADEFHDNILKYSSDQYGTEYSKIYLLFPESKQKIIIGSLVMGSLKRLNEFRKIFIKEHDKSEETYVRLIEYIYPKSLTFLEQYKTVLEYSQCDLSSSLEQETSIFLRIVEAIYMNKEKNLLNSFIQTSYHSIIRQMTLLKNEYSSKAMTLETIQTRFRNIIANTEFSKLHQKSKVTISRYNVLIRNKDEKEDLIDTFSKEVFDSIQELLIEYCSMGKFILQECQKHSFPLNETHYCYLSYISSSANEFKRLFLYELRDFFSSVKFYEQIAMYVVNCLDKVDAGIDNLFSELSSYTSVSLDKIFKLIKYKEIYKLSANNTIQITAEFDRLCAFIMEFFKCMNDNWIGMDRNKSMICLVFSNKITTKMNDIMIHAKLTENGITVMKNDFQKVGNLFAEYLDEFYSSKIFDIVFLNEIFTTTKGEIASFTQTLEKSKKYDTNLIKILVKRRKELKID